MLLAGSLWSTFWSGVQRLTVCRADNCLIGTAFFCAYLSWCAPLHHPLHSPHSCIPRCVRVVPSERASTKEQLEEVNPRYATSDEPCRPLRAASATSSRA